MSCYNINCTANQSTNQSAAAPIDDPVQAADAHAGVLWRVGRHLLSSIQRRQAGRVRLGRLLDAGWTGSTNRNAANPARSEQ